MAPPAKAQPGLQRREQAAVQGLVSPTPSQPYSLPASRVDAEPISWLAGEIGVALKQSFGALQEAAAQDTTAGCDGGTAALRRARTCLHQADGALRMLEVEGVTLLTDAVDKVLEGAGAHERPLDTMLLQTVDQAYLAIQEYLDELEGGAQPQPVRLFPYYRGLLEILGAERIHAADLFFPDSGIEPHLAPGLHAGEAVDYVGLRQRFEKALLRFLKHPAEADALGMCQIISEVEQAQEQQHCRAFWWVMHGFADAVATRQVTHDLATKQLFGRINSQLRRLGEGGFSVNHAILKEALFYIALSSEPAPLQRQIRAAYQLEGTLPADFDSRRYGQSDLAALRAARERLAHAKGMWNRIVQGESNAVSGFEQDMDGLAATFENLNSAPLSHLLDEVNLIARHAARAGLQEPIALEVATGLLVLDSGLTDIRHLPEQFAARAEAMIERLRLLDGGAAPSNQPVAGIEDSFRQVQDQAVGALVTEMRTALREVETILDAFFRNKGEPAALAQVKPLLHQLEGALAILEQDAAVCVLRHTQIVVGEFADSQAAPDEQTLKELAQNVGALGLFMEALQRNPADARKHFAFDAETSVFHLLNPHPAAALPAQQSRQSPAEMREPEERALRMDLAEPLSRGQSASAPVQSASDQVVSTASLADLSGSENAGAGPAELTLKEAALEPITAPITATVTAPMAAPMAAPAAALGDDEDRELRQIFFEEAEEVLQSLDGLLRSGPGAGGSTAQMPILRRCFHTLKGSARMVGLGELGSAAHGIERLLDGRLAGDMAPDEALTLLLQRAHGEFVDWVRDLRQGAASSHTAEEFRLVVGPSDDNALVPDWAEHTAPDTAQSGSAILAHESRQTVAVVAPDPLFKQIGPLQISLPLYAIYRAEAEGLVQLLSVDLGGWRQQPDRYVHLPAVHAAHSLAGSSATVGLAPVHELGFAIEAILQHQVRKPVKLAVYEFDMLAQAIERIRYLLEEIDAGRMPGSEPDMVQVLQRVLHDIGSRSDAWLEQTALDTSPAPDEPMAAPPGASQVLRVDAFLASRFEADTVAVTDAPDADLLPVFIEEARDIMPLFGQTLRDWRRRPDDNALANALLRMAHTLKGSARMAGAMRLGEHMHQMETRIETYLQSQPVAPPVFDDLLLQHDRAMQLYEQLLTVIGAEEASGEASDPAAAAAATAGARTGAPAAAPLVRVQADILDRLVNQAGEVSISRSKLETEIASLALSLTDLNENIVRLRQQLREVAIQAESQISAQASPSIEREFDALEFDRYTRLQELTHMMAESVDDIGSVQQSLNHSLASASAGFAAQARLTRELQQDLMRVRMVQFGSISDRLYRVVRQTAKEAGKRVNLDIRGASQEVDRSVLDRMAGPFEHLLRNAIVHGIESQAARQATGKNENGDLVIEVRQEGNEVVLQFADDGAGLDLPAIRGRAVAQGLLEEAATATDAELVELIFNSGFSTAGALTQAAGRGVGMDAVRSEVTRLGGNVAIVTESGRGMRLTIRLPLTLAVTQVVLLSSGGRTYAVPSFMIDQVLQMKTEAFAAACAEGAVEWQTQRIRVVELPALLGERNGAPQWQDQPQPYSPVVILRNGDQRVAIHVDNVIGNREVVVKNVGTQLARVAGIAGATVLGSGQIVLILNPLQLLQRLEQPRQEETQTTEPGARLAVEPERPKLVMVVDDSMTVRRVTQRLLLREGYQVVLAKDGVDALERLQSVIPDVMLVDIEMPRMDGFDLTRNVRDDLRTRQIPIIIITSRTASKHRNFAMELGVDGYFGKPYQESDLLKAIARAIKGRLIGLMENIDTSGAAVV